MVKIFTPQSRMELDPSRGLQWNLLEFLHPEKNQWISVIKGFSEENFLGSGSYILFPWVNRLEENFLKNRRDFPWFHNSDIQNNLPFRDGQGIPLHGLVADRKWEILSQSENRVHCRLMNKSEIETSSQGIAYSLEAVLTLEYDSLRVDTIVKIENRPPSREKISYALGFHPYFSLSGNKAERIQIVGGEELELDPRTNLPMEGKQGFVARKLISPSPDESTLLDLAFSSSEFSSSRINLYPCEGGLDSLFHLKKGLDIRFWDTSLGYGISLREEGRGEGSLFPYAQIYTPGEGDSVAIEPMTSVGNFLQFPNEKFISVFPNHEKKFTFLVNFFPVSGI